MCDCTGVDDTANFLRAARAGNIEKVLDFLKNNIDVNYCNTNGLTALHLASKEGHIKLITELLNHGADANASTTKGFTSLHVAAISGKKDVVDILVRNKASIDRQETESQPCIWRHKKIMSRLSHFY